MMSGLIGCLLLTGATALGGLEYAMGPNQRRFPCVNKKTLFILRLYTLALVGAAMDRLYHSAIGAPLPWTTFQVFTAVMLATAHIALFAQVLRQRLPEGVWPYLQLRMSRAKKAAKAGGPAGATMAREIADPDATISPGLYQPPKSWHSVLQRLAGLP